MAVHATLESSACFGLATTGTHVGALQLQRIDTLFLKKVARRAVGTNSTMRVETMLSMPDICGALRHFVVGISQVADRNLRAKGTAAQENAKRELQLRYTVDLDEDDSKEEK